MYAVDEGPYYTEKSTFALNGLREKTEVILAAAARGCVSGSSVRRARPSVLRPDRPAPPPFNLCVAAAISSHNASSAAPRLLHPHIYRALFIFLPRCIQ